MAEPKPTILIAESVDFSPVATALLQTAGEVSLADLDRAGLLRAVGSADVLWVRLRHLIDAELLERAPRLTTLVTPTTGLNHIDLAAAAARGIRVLSLQGDQEFLKHVHATAEHTLALILALLRHVAAAQAHVLAGGWERDRFRGNELFGKTAGIVGYGRLGRIVAGYLQAFGMHVDATDPHVAEADTAPGVALVPLPELLREADLVSLHVNLTTATTKLVGRDFFSRLKPGAWFVNTARGELVDEPALLEALQSGRLAGAALDVLAQERATGMADHPLVQYARTHANLILTPHLGGCTAESMAKTELWMAQKLCGELTAQRPATQAACAG